MKHPITPTLLIAALALLPFGWTGCAVNGQNTPTPNMENQNDSLSYALGVLFATNVTSQGIKDYVPAQIAQAFADVQSGNAAMTPEQANELVRTTMQAKEAAAGEENLKAGQDFLAANKSEDGVIETASGLQYRVDREGDGDSPDANDRVTVHYHGTLIDPPDHLRQRHPGRLRAGEERGRGGGAIDPPDGPPRSAHRGPPLPEPGGRPHRRDSGDH